ncbi:putative fungistatic metabolite like protein [Verticillium longisporum]|nr:putative fungistatic metabolite like protein [Verticillium longisporum]
MRFLSNVSGLLLATTGAQAFFVVPCSRPVVVQRADPIVNPGALAGHVHTIMGGSAFNFTMSYDDAVSSACSTCKVRQDLSNYWTPNLYYESENGKFEAVKQLGGMLVYYLQRSDSRDPEYENGLLAFPPGFQMLAGDPSLRSFGDTLEQRAISYVCLGVSGPETHQFPPQNCPYGLRVQVMFPSCWDGHNLDSPNHKSHMAYPSLVDNGVCPTSHPKRFITLFYEVTFQIDDFKDKWYKDTPPFVYSNGDPTGYGLHGDFVNGWDTDVLQSAITNCTDASGSLNRCPLLHQFDDETMKGCRVPVRVEEQVDGTLNKLPGCNPVQRGPGRATQQSGCGATTTISPPQWPYTDMTISHRFRYRGCAPDASGKSRTLNGTDVSSDNMTVARCVEYCDERGFKYAGVEYRRECFCGNFVDHDREPKKGILGVCELPCTGDNNEVCGGYGGISLYEKCSAGAACENADLV